VRLWACPVMDPSRRGPSTGHFSDDRDLGSIARPEYGSGSRPRPSSSSAAAEDDRAGGGELVSDQLAQFIVT